MKKRVGMFLAAAMATVCAQADIWTDPDTGYMWWYQINGITAETLGYVRPIPAVAVTIPSMISGYPVTGIGQSAFAHFNELASVTIPDGVTSIGSFAFYDCSDLTSMTISFSVTTIGTWAFKDCSALTNITFAGNAPAIGEKAFDGVAPGCCAYVRRGSTGWGVSIPGTWNGLRIEYIDGVGPAYSVPSWARGDFYGTAKPGKKGDPMAYLQFTVGKTGKVSGKVTYKGKAYSFSSTLSSCTASKAAFTPKVKIGKATFKPGAVTIRKTENAGGWLVEAANKKGTFTGQKKANLVKKGKALAKLIGKSFTFTKKTKNSGLTKSGDKLKVKLANGDKVTASGTVNGKKLTALSAPLIVSEVSALPGMTTYTLYADILDAKTKYYKTVVFTVKVPVVLNPVPKVSAAFAK